MEVSVEVGATIGAKLDGEVEEGRQVGAMTYAGSEEEMRAKAQGRVAGERLPQETRMVKRAGIWKPQVRRWGWRRPLRWAPHILQGDLVLVDYGQQLSAVLSQHCPYPQYTALWWCVDRVRGMEKSVDVHSCS